MRRHLLTASGSLVFSVLLALTAFTVQAKGPADKITISGPELTTAIEVTDPKALDEFSPWDDKFMDESRGAVPDPHAAKVYPISILVEPQWLYRFDYAPDPSGGPGYIHLPGPGDPRYGRNTGTIIRSADGQWLYASQDWAMLMQRVLPRAASQNALPATAAGPSPLMTWATILGVLALAVASSLLWRARKSKTR